MSLGKKYSRVFLKRDHVSPSYSISMTSSRLGVPLEEFVNGPEDQHIGSAFRTATRFSNMDTAHQKIALGIIAGVAFFSATLGFLCMFAISQSSLAMMSRLNRDSITDEHFITEEIFERIDRDSMKRYLEYLTEYPHPAGSRKEEEFTNWIKKGMWWPMSSWVRIVNNKKMYSEM